MGFLKSLFGIEEEETSSKKIEEGLESNIDTTFVTNQEEQDFSSSIFGQLELLDADVKYIEDVLPQNGAELRNQIKALRNSLLESNSEENFEVQNSFEDLKVKFDEARRMADGEYLLRQLEQQNLSMDKMFEKSLRNGGITKQKLEEYIEYIKKIQVKVSDSDNEIAPILKGVKRQKFNEISIRSEYRIKMLELMYLLNDGDLKTNPFKSLSRLKQKMFSKYFFEDAKNAAEQYNLLSYFEEAFSDTYYFGSIDDIAKKLDSQIEDAVITDEFSIMELFDSENQSTESFEFLKKFVKFKTTLNEMRDIKDKKLEEHEAKVKKMREEQEKKDEQKRKEQEAENAKIEEEKRRIEKYKNMTNEEIDAEIYRIEHDLKATGSRYVNILDFQKEIARARGLLQSEPEIQSDELAYKTMTPAQIIIFLKEAQENGVNYTILPDSQEFKNKKNNYLVVVSKTDEKSLSPKQEAPVFAGYNYVSGYKDINFGKFPAWILNSLDKNLDKDLELSGNLAVQKSEDGLYELSYFQRNGDKGSKSKREKEIYDTLTRILNYLPDTDEISDKSLKDIMCYIQTPAIRNIIPVLELFKNSEVTAFIEPVPKEKRNTNSRDNINIYFRREDLPKVSSDILPQISGPDKGIILLKKEYIDLARESARMSVWNNEKALKEL